jgi:dolichol-phosphate mannosyltransferase
MLLQEWWDQLRHLKRQFESKAGSLARPIQFGAVGGTGTVVDLCVFSLLLYFGMFLSVARALAILVAMTWNFYLNRRLTFSYARNGSALHQYLLFCASCSLGALISWSVSVTLGSQLAYFGGHPRQAALAGIACGLASNFFLSSKVVFRIKSRPRAAESMPLQRREERASQAVGA